VLYGYYSDGLLNRLAKCCSIIGLNFLGALVYADDIVLLAPTSSAIRKLLNICDDYARGYSITFNGKKSNDAGAGLYCYKSNDAGAGLYCYPLADSYLNKFSLTACGAAESAAKRKCEKYAGISSSYLFQPIANETLGTQSELVYVYMVERSTTFLFSKRISICLQRFIALKRPSGPSLIDS